MEQKPTLDRQASDTSPKARKPYVPPAFTHERAFETMALACGKINTNQAQCKTNRKNS